MNSEKYVSLSSFCIQKTRNLVFNPDLPSQMSVPASLMDWTLSVYKAIPGLNTSKSENSGQLLKESMMDFELLVSDAVQNGFDFSYMLTIKSLHQ